MCLPMDDMRPYARIHLSFYIFKKIKMNAWFWPSSLLKKLHLDIARRVQLPVLTPTAVAKGLSVLKSKSPPRVFLRVPPTTQLFIVVSFDLFLFFFLSISFLQRCATMSCHRYTLPVFLSLCRISRWKPLKLIEIRTGKTRQSIDTNWLSLMCALRKLKRIAAQKTIETQEKKKRCTIPNTVTGTCYILGYTGYFLDFTRLGFYSI